MTTTHAQAMHTPAEERMTRQVSSELVGEAIASLAVVALAVVGLAGTFAPTMAGIAVVVLGASILVESGFFNGTAEVLERGEWLTSQFLGGFTGIVLGVLALLGVASEVLLATAAIVFGTTLLFASVAKRNFSGHALAGMGAVVLGVLAVVGLSQWTLILVAMLCLGAMGVFTSAAYGAQIVARKGR